VALAGKSLLDWTPSGSSLDALLSKTCVVSSLVTVALLTFGFGLPFDCAPIVPLLLLNIEVELLLEPVAMEPILLFDIEAVAIELAPMNKTERKALPVKRIILFIKITPLNQLKNHPLRHIGLANEGRIGQNLFLCQQVHNSFDLFCLPYAPPLLFNAYNVIL
jgi:hypothetical protein